jgi:hypothetical protein
MSRTKIFENMESITSDMAFTEFNTAKRALSFQQKRAFNQEILFSFFKWAILAQKNGTFHFAHAPIAPGSAAPARYEYSRRRRLQLLMHKYLHNVFV